MAEPICGSEAKSSATARPSCKLNALACELDAPAGCKLDAPAGCKLDAPAGCKLDAPAICSREPLIPARP
jgi:hypothetical protein